MPSARAAPGSPRGEGDPVIGWCVVKDRIDIVVDSEHDCFRTDLAVGSKELLHGALALWAVDAIGMVLGTFEETDISFYTVGCGKRC